MDCLVDIGNDLVDSGNDNHGIGTEQQRCNAVGTTVDIVKFPVLGDGIGAHDKDIGGHGAAHDVLQLIRCQIRRITVKEIVISRTEQVDCADFIQRDGTADTDGASRRQIRFQRGQRIPGVGNIYGFKVVSAQIFKRCTNADCLHFFHYFMHGSTICF